MSVLEGKTILLTGANGFIGSHLAEFLHKVPNVKLIFMSRKPLQQHYSNVVHVEEDLTLLSKNTWAKYGIGQIDYVFHLAGFTPKKATEADSAEQIYTCNLLGTKTLLDSLPNVPKKIIFSSTLDVYAASVGDQIISERSPLGDANLYGISKLFCERLIVAFAKKYGSDYALLRYGHIYGPGEDEYLKLIPQTILNILNNRPPKIYGEGKALRDFLFVKDAVLATIKAAESSENYIDPVNIVSGVSVSIIEVVNCLINISGKSDLLCEYIEDNNQKSFIFDNQRMDEKLGSWCKVSLLDGLTQEYEVMKEKHL